MIKFIQILLEINFNSIVFILIACNLYVCHDYDSQDIISNGHYMNLWVVHIPSGQAISDKLAKQKGFSNLGAIRGFEDYYLFRKEEHPKRTKRHAIDLTNKLINDERVKWTEQQISRKRSKRDSISLKSLWLQYIRSVDPLERGKKHPFGDRDNSFNDELWNRQWYLHDTTNIPTFPRMDLGVKEAWKMGFTGRGVVVSVLDDGLEWRHSDIHKNYDKNASCDTNDNDLDPSPRYDKYDSNSHGTRCAGEIAMVAHNKKCGVGLAYNARIGGIRCLDGEVSDVIEALSLGFNINYIDIYSSSWGPNDDGMTIDGPKRLASEALHKGITFGRRGKGCIYVWASGNGGMKGDNCNCDGYASSIYTISIGSASQTGQFPWYGERCASTMAVTYSSGAYTDQKIATTDLHDKCTIDHSGTSAAAPLAAAILALVLEANPNITWRDAQHLVVCTAQFSPLLENKSWKRNGAGFMYNSRFGFGLMKADLLIMAALKWINVPPKQMCFIRSKSSLPIDMTSGQEIQINFINYENCFINFLEHVQINIHMDYTKRGNLQILLISPKGSVTMLLTLRPKDSSVFGFRGWNLTTVHLWGENPKGHWRLIIRDAKNDSHRGRVKNVVLILHGTREPPGCLRFGPRRYEDEDLISRTIDMTPEYLEDNYDQNEMPNELNVLKSPTQLDWINDLIAR